MKLTLRIFLILAVLLWGLIPTGGLFAAQSDSVTLKVKVTNSPAVITGKVTELDGITPVPQGTWVSIWVQGKVWQGENYRLTYTTTKNDGSYQLYFDGNSGLYDFDSGTLGYITQIKTNIQVTKGQITDLNFKLSKSAGIQGKVTKPDGNPAPQGTRISVFRQGHYGEDAHLITYSLTQADGTYILYWNLPEGTYDIGSGGIGYIEDKKLNQFLKAGQLTTLNFTLGISAGFKGKVTDQNGNGLYGAYIFAKQNNNLITQGVTQWDGAYLIHYNLPTGTYDIEAEYPGYPSQVKTNIQLTAGQVLPDVNFTMTPDTTSPQAISITPSSLTTNPDVAQTMTTLVSDPDGYLNIAYCQFLINTTSLDGLRCFYGHYDRIANKLYLMSDTGTWAGGFAPGSTNTIENSYSKLDCQGSSVTQSGNNLAVSWKLTFKSSFTGSKNSYLYVGDTTNAISGWKQLGTVSISNNPPQAISVTPSSLTTNPDVAQTMTTLVSDPDGYLNIAYCQFLINTNSTDGLRCFYVDYHRLENKLYLMSDTGSWIGGFAPGSANTIENSYSKLDCQGSSVTQSGNNLTVNWKITFKSSFTGNKNSYLYVGDTANDTSGWKELGSVWVGVDTTPPTGTITINNDAQYTNSAQVTLNLSATDNLSGVDKMSFSHNGVDWSQREDYSTTKTWNLSTGDGEKWVFVKFRDKAGNWSQAYSDTIILDTTPPSPPTINPVTSPTNINSQTITGTKSQDTVTIIISCPTASIGALTYPTNTTWSCELTNLTSGTNSITVKAKDAAGNESNSVSASIRYNPSNHSPVINSITPVDNSTFLAGARINIQINATDPDNDSLEYQFSIDGTIKQPWSSSNTYEWVTTADDTGTANIRCETRDNQGGLDAKTLTYNIINPTAEEILQKVPDNYSLIDDLKANMTISTTLDSQPFGEEGYYIYYFKKSKKEKIETYSSAERIEKIDITIIDDSTMYLVDPITKAIQQVDLLADSGINSSQFNQMDIQYNLTEFLNGHNVRKNDTDSDLANFIVAIEATPKTENSLYTKLELFIAYNKGLLVKSLLFKNESLIEKFELQESKNMSNGAWLPVEMVKVPTLTSGNMVNTLIYSDVQINIGLIDNDFDPQEQ